MALSKEIWWGLSAYHTNTMPLCPYQRKHGGAWAPMILTPCPYGPITGNMVELERLNLCDNRLESVPGSIGCCTKYAAFNPIMLSPCPYDPIMLSPCPYDPIMLPPCPYDPIMLSPCPYDPSCYHHAPMPLSCYHHDPMAV